MVTQPKPPSQKPYGKEVTVVHGMRMFCCRWVLFLKCQLSVTSADPHLILNAGLKRSACPSMHFNARLILRASWKSILSVVNKVNGFSWHCKIEFSHTWNKMHHIHKQKEWLISSEGFLFVSEVVFSRERGVVCKIDTTVLALLLLNISCHVRNCYLFTLHSWRREGEEARGKGTGRVLVFSYLNAARYPSL